MMISTKGRYALRVLIYLSKEADKGLIPLKNIAEKQNISLKYLERIMTMLSKADFVVSLHGKGGGYSRIQCGLQQSFRKALCSCNNG